jgi:hypothetical protein
MKPVDLRNATWGDVLLHITEDMHRVHAAWLRHGPGTTREVADRAGISLLTFRPRTTDLYQLGVVVLEGKSGTEGVYSARSLDEAKAAWDSGERPEADENAAVARFRARLDRQINTLPMRDQLSIAAAIMARAGHAKKHTGPGKGAMQEEMSFA